MEKTICELFAGVGGFRLGFNKLNSGWETVWFSQWEPKAATQHAYNCYVKHFGKLLDLKGEDHNNDDISLVKKENIPDHNLLVGGFPCQDYSVARSLSKEKGIEGKKGVLWWQIYDTLVAKEPPFCLFENVDRLLKSPSKQRGRDFGIMLTCLNNLGYSVEWRVVNAATYGAGQRRRRTFIFAYKDSTNYFTNQKELTSKNIIKSDGFFAKTFPIKEMSEIKSINLFDDPAEATKNFKFDFCNAGFMTNGTVYTSKIVELEEEPTPIIKLLESDVDKKYYITNAKMDKWKYLKGAKKIPRVSETGHEYIYSEGPVAFPDAWDKPARTMLTSESTVNRSSHVVKDPKTLKLRIITPKEAERFQGFDDDWTNTGMTERMRYFCMGNALVVSMVTRMGKTLDDIFKQE